MLIAQGLFPDIFLKVINETAVEFIAIEKRVTFVYNLFRRLDLCSLLLLSICLGDSKKFFYYFLQIFHRSLMVCLLAKYSLYTLCCCKTSTTNINILSAASFLAPSLTPLHKPMSTDIRHTVAYMARAISSLIRMWQAEP